MVYNGFKNWETWVTSMNYGDIAYNMAKAYMKNGLTYDNYRIEIEDLIRKDTYNGMKLPGEYNLVSEFIMSSLAVVDFDHLADSNWNNALNDQ